MLLAMCSICSADDASSAPDMNSSLKTLGLTTLGWALAIKGDAQSCSFFIHGGGWGGFLDNVIEGKEFCYCNWL